jgi:hypothetical protein
MTIKKLLAIHIAIAALCGSLYASGESAGSSMSKVTIVIYGMMKSKSGAT